MRILIYISLILISSLFFIRCKKECNNCEKRFEVGVDKGFYDIILIDSVIILNALWHGSDRIHFDIDKDGLADFEIGSRHSASPGGINYQNSYIKVITLSFYISSTSISDTLYKCVETYNDSLFHPTYYNNLSVYSCNDSNVYVETKNYKYPKIFSYKEGLSENETWSQSELPFSLYNISASHASSYDIVRGNWNNLGPKYIAFKKEAEEKDLYGWFKISISDYKKIQIYEFAFQNQ